MLILFKQNCSIKWFTVNCGQLRPKLSSAFCPEAAKTGPACCGHCLPTDGPLSVSCQALSWTPPAWRTAQRWTATPGCSNGVVARVGQVDCVPPYLVPLVFQLFPGAHHPHGADPQTETEVFDILPPIHDCQLQVSPSGWPRGPCPHSIPQPGTWELRRRQPSFCYQPPQKEVWHSRKLSTAAPLEPLPGPHQCGSQCANRYQASLFCPRQVVVVNQYLVDYCAVVPLVLQRRLQLVCQLSHPGLGDAPPRLD